MKDLHITTITTAELYDLTMLQELDDTEYLLDMLQSLVSDMPEDMNTLKTAFQKDDIPAVCQTAHKIKNSAGIIQAKNLMDLMQQIEIAGKINAVSEIPALIEAAADLYNHIETALKNHISELI